MRGEREGDRDPASDRVAEMHRHTRRGLAISGAFAIAAVVGAVVPHRTGVWLPLHLFFVGSLTSAISTVTQMLAVTWSASPPPPRRAVWLQHWALAGGAILVVAGREADDRVITGIGGTIVGASLVAVGVVLVRVRRAARTPRFAPAIDAYLLALGAAVVGVGLGVEMATSATSWNTRNAHLVLNVFAFVGVVIAGTLPYFVATQARTKMSPRATPVRVRTTTVALWTTAVCAAAGAASGHREVTAVALACYAIGVAAVSSVLPRPRRKNVSWAGPRLLQLYTGLAWWSVMSAWTAVVLWRSAVDRPAIAALAIGGFAQILAASFAYLVPVVRGGGHEALSTGFRQTRSWTGLVLGNVAATLALLGHERLMVAAVSAWAVDASARMLIGRRIAS